MGLHEYAFGCWFLAGCEVHTTFQYIFRLLCSKMLPNSELPRERSELFICIRAAATSDANLSMTSCKRLETVLVGAAVEGITSSHD